ncbi:MAG TPA: hypothetical protein EYG23_00995 [Candidatus Poseidoniales archaeon]|nr:MAG: hypothetical protein CXT64_03355 [Euryarchaeota archaeon]HIL49614.1 hypothetical protein [Candidatus Poseidoniales archaeon]
MSTRLRRATKGSAIAALVLLLVGVAAYASSYDELARLMNPEENNLADLHSGESAQIEISGGSQIAALRLINESSTENPQVRLVGVDGEEEGREPNLLDTKWISEDGGRIYEAVRIYEPGLTGTFTIHNDAEQRLIVVDNAELQSKLLAEPLLLLMMISCCGGLSATLAAIILFFLQLRNRSETEQKVSGLVVDGQVMTTNELYRMQRGGAKEEPVDSAVADPFVDRESKTTRQEEIPDSKEESADSAKIDSDSVEWRSWDEG